LARHITGFDVSIQGLGDIHIVFVFAQHCIGHGSRVFLVGSRRPFSWRFVFVSIVSLSLWVWIVVAIYIYIYISQ
jgi:hypothetical protein